MKKPEEIKKVKGDPTCFECNHYEVCQKWSNAGYLHRDNPKKCSDFTGRSAERRRISALEIVVDEQDKAIQRLEAQVPRWISVEERLPPNDDAVLIIVHNKSDAWTSVMIDVFDDGVWLDNADDDWHIVTHWMPLPEAPKEDVHEKG